MAAKVDTVAKITKVRVIQGVLDHIQRRAVEEDDKGGFEAVGFLLSRPGLPITGTSDFHNHAPNPQNAFFVEPWEQYRAYEAAEQAGMKVAGVWHSHTTGEARPSQADEKMARLREFVAIYSVRFGEVTFWFCPRENTLEPVELLPVTLKELDQ